MPYKTARIPVTYKCYGDILNFNTVFPGCIRLVKTGIAINFIEIVYTQIICRTLIFYNIIFPKDPSDIFSYRHFLFLFYDQHVNLLWFCPQLMFIFKNQKTCLRFQLNLNIGIKGRMPLQHMCPPFFHIKPPPYSIIEKRFVDFLLS